jgi:hypothetical protein
MASATQGSNSMAAAITSAAEAAAKINLAYFASFRLSRKEYQGTLSRSQMFGYAAYVIATTGTGAGIGAACGSAAGGLGAGPGAGIGASVGLVVGLATGSIHRFATNFQVWKKTQKESVVREFYDRFKEVSEFQGFKLQCPLTKTLAHDPVKTPYSDDVYEREAIEKHIHEYGACPVTKKPLKIEDLKTSLSALAHANRICKEIIAPRVGALPLSKEQHEGLKMLLEDASDNMYYFQEQERKNMEALVKAKKMSYQEFARNMLAISEVTAPSYI